MISQIVITILLICDKNKIISTYIYNMGLRGIITKSKEEFLQVEREWFPSMSTEEYYKYMIEDVDSCKNCGVVYWKDCNKRCDCDN